MIDPEALRAELAGFGGQPGVRPLRLLLDKLFFRLSDSDLEIYFRRIVRAAKLPMPLSKQRVNNFEVDSSGLNLSWLVETDRLSMLPLKKRHLGWSAGGDVRLRAAVGKQF